MDVFGEQMRGKAMGSVQPKGYATPGPASSDEAEGASPCAPENAPAAYSRRTWKHSLGIGAACFIVYLVVLEAFLAVPQFNDIVQVRPASAFGPVLGLFFGLPGILGCAAANLVSDILHIGMSLSVFMLFSGCAGILETGAVALCARALGNRDAERVNVLFSVSLFAAVVVGVALSVGGVTGADALATLLGAASGQLHADTAAYLSGICSGAFAIVLLQLLMGFTRLDNAPQLGIVALVGMSVCDVVFNLIAVCVLDLGLRGMGLATALAYCVAVAVCCTHFASKGNTLR